MLSLNFTPKKPFSSKPTNRPLLHSNSHIFYSSSTSLSLKFQKKPRVVASVFASETSTNNDKVVEVPTGLSRDAMPRHVAIIMDGNVRWAKNRGLHGSAGHQAGVKSLMQIVDLSMKWGVKVLTVFAFSYDNWARPRVEVEFLMSLFEQKIKSISDNFIRQGIRISIIGDSSKLPKTLQKLIINAQETTKDSKNLQLIVALSYSGKYDIIQACRNISEKVKNGKIQVQDINEQLMEQQLQTNCTEYPYPDLLIRTSGEFRVSNFLLWQLAYTELYFSRVFWPEFGEDEFFEALKSYQRRNRRYGGRDHKNGA